MKGIDGDNGLSLVKFYATLLGKQSELRVLACIPHCAEVASRRELVLKLIKDALTEQQAELLILNFGLNGSSPVSLAKLSINYETTPSNMSERRSYAMAVLKSQWVPEMKMLIELSDPELEKEKQRLQQKLSQLSDQVSMEAYEIKRTLRCLGCKGVVGVEEEILYRPITILDLSPDVVKNLRYGGIFTVFHLRNSSEQRVRDLLFRTNRGGEINKVTKALNSIGYSYAG